MWASIFSFSGVQFLWRGTRKFLLAPRVGGAHEARRLPVSFGFELWEPSGLQNRVAQVRFLPGPLLSQPFSPKGIVREVRRRTLQVCALGCDSPRFHQQVVTRRAALARAVRFATPVRDGSIPSRVSEKSTKKILPECAVHLGRLISILTWFDSMRQDHSTVARHRWDRRCCQRRSRQLAKPPVRHAGIAGFDSQDLHEHVSCSGGGTGIRTRLRPWALRGQ